MGRKGYFVCCKNRSARCKARANCDLSSDPWELTITKPHNHPQDHSEKIAIEFMEHLKLVCKSGIDLSPKDIYEDVAKIYPVGARLKPYEMMRTTLARWKTEDD